MGLNKFERQLKLMLMLTQNRRYTIEEIGDRLDLSLRSTYRYLEFFKENGFDVVKERGIYRLDKSSSYFRQISELIHFTEDEALTLKMVLEGLPNKTLAIKQLLNKLSRIYDLQLFEEIASNEQFAKNQQNLYKATKEGRQCLLKNYNSSHSNTTTDRLIEPFAFLASNTEIRAFEVNSKENKTYKITRIGEVIILDTNWDYRPFHKQVYTDAFHFSGEELIPIKLRLDRLSANLLKEEVVVRDNELVSDGEDHWVYSTEVCRFEGIGRFIMGLLNNVEILENKELKKYIKAKIKEGLKAL